MTSPGRRLRELLARPGLVHAIGTHDAISSRLVEQAGFECVYVGGAASFLADHGLPDVGLVTMTELIEHVRRITAAVSIPVVVDLDDGGGNPLRVRRAVQLAERADVAAFHIEDTDFSDGKHFATSDGSGRQGVDRDRDRLRPAKEFARSVRAAVEARRSEDTVVIARTDAAMHSVEEAIERAGLYAEEGADMIFFHWVPREDLRRVVASVDVPVMCMAHDVTAAELRAIQEDGVKLFFRPSLTWTIGVRAMKDVLTELHENGEIAEFENRRMRPADRFEAVGAYEWTELGQRYGMLDPRES